MVAGLLTGADALASPATPLVAEVEVSSGRARRAAAFDALGPTAWCPTAKDASAALTIRFERPVRARSLTVYAGRPDPGRRSGDWYRPPPVEITIGGPPFTVDPSGNGQSPLEVDAARDASFQTSTLRLLPGGAGAQRCLAEVALELTEGPWVFGVSAVSAGRLPAFVTEVTGALRACDRPAIARLARFPLRRRELQVGFAGAELHPAPAATPPYPDARALTRQCRELVFPEGERDPVLARPLGPGRVRIEANRGGGVLYWHARWARGRWALDELAFTDFE